MKFSYEYRTRDNVKCRDTIDAADREAVYTILKSRGIRPSSVVEAPGLFNKLFGKGKRWIAIVVLGGCSVGLAIALGKARAPSASQSPLPRQQIYGDPLVLQQCEAAAWSNVFPDAGDRLLASYAQPGRDVPTNGVSSVSISTEHVALAAGDAPEVARMKRIVNGMKDELACYLADGGDVAKYVGRLEERQRIEMRILLYKTGELERLRKYAEQDRQKAAENWSSINRELRSFGLKTVEMPEELL